MSTRSQSYDVDSDQPYRWIPDEDESFVEPEVEFDDNVDDDDDEEQYRHPHAGDDEDIKGTGVFKQEIQRDPEICSSCFLQNYDVIIPYSPRRSVRPGLVRYFIPANDTTRPLSQAARECSNPPRACQCGRVGTLRDRPLPKDRAIDYAWNLSKTLAQKGIEHNPLLLAFVVACRKRLPEEASRDDRNYDLATAQSLPTYQFDFSDLFETPPQLPPGQPTDSSAPSFSRHRNKLSFAE